MSANLHRKKNWFEKLAPLWAVILMAGHVGAMLYYYFVADSFEQLDTYNSWLKYVIWGAVVIVAVFSFVPEDVTAVVRHTVFYIVSGGVFIGVLWWYSHNVFTPEEGESRAVLAMFMSQFTDTDYVSYYMRYAILSTLGLCAAVAAFFSLDCLADTQYLPVGVTTNVDVAADATLSDTISLADRTAVVKGGAGKLTVPSGKFIQDTTVDIRVREGGVALTATQQELDAYPQPTETMNKAAFWLESSMNLVKDGDDIKVWRDVRDTDSSVTNHYFAVTDNTWADLCPQSATYKEKSAVYFRGYQSGCWMNWQEPAGGQAKVDKLRHVFLVHGAESRWGFALGQHYGQSPCFQPGEPGGGTSAVMWIGHNNENKPMHASRSFRDGVEVDAFTTSQGTGIHVVEVDCLEQTQSAQCFFNDRDFWKDANGYNPMFGETSTKQTTGGKRAGGEYICEMLLFTNRLSEAERVGISNCCSRSGAARCRRRSSPLP